MKIVQINPGLLPIPRTYYGAIEKIIWDYKIFLEKLGHTCDIKYPNEIKINEYDIVHSHVWNHTIELNNQGISVVNHLHDHHTIRFGKGSQCFKNNQEAVKKSVLSIVPAEFLVNYFDHPYKTFYLNHGVNTLEFFPLPRGKEQKLLCLANNGYADNSTIDRKGFEPAIEAARLLSLPITIAGPSKNNYEFFKIRNDLLKYNKLEVLFDLTDAEILSLYQRHSIFLHLSELEAGHPNLTILEAMACGLPVVGTYSGLYSLEGLKKVGRDAMEAKNAIVEILNNYSDYQNKALDTAKANCYSITINKLVNIYESILKVKTNCDSEQFRKSLTTEYTTTQKIVRPFKQIPDDSFVIHFINGAFVEIVGSSGKSYNVEFINRETNIVIYSTQLKTNTWAQVNLKYFINYDIRIKEATTNKLVLRHLFDANEKSVYIHIDTNAIGDTIAFFPYIEDFRIKHNCKLFCSTFHNHLFEKKYPHINFIAPGSNVSNIYAMYNLGLYVTDSNVDLSKHPTDPRMIPLQQIAADILGVNFQEKPPLINFESSPRPLQNKYVCISPNSTALCKYWNYPDGWQKIVDYLNLKGFKVVLLQKETTTNLKNIIIPVDKTIDTAINYLKSCEFLVSISTGIAWLAFCLNKKTLMISGITKNWNEFQSNCVHIVPDDHICNGCFNDNRFVFGSQAKNEWEWCPNHKNISEKFICTKSIKPAQVINEINQIITNLV
jgi:autotransporter strand-loop-strand O-heptosyltransferase